MRMGSVVKAVLRFREPVWATKAGTQGGFRARSRRCFPSWWRAGPPELPVVIGWAGGPRPPSSARGIRSRPHWPRWGASWAAPPLTGRTARVREHRRLGPGSLFAGRVRLPSAEAPLRPPPTLRAEENTLFFAGEATSSTRGAARWTARWKAGCALRARSCEALIRPPARFPCTLAAAWKSCASGDRSEGGCSR